MSLVAPRLVFVSEHTQLVAPTKQKRPVGINLLQL